MVAEHKHLAHRLARTHEILMTQYTALTRECTPGGTDNEAFQAAEAGMRKSIEQLRLAASQLALGIAGAELFNRFSHSGFGRLECFVISLSRVEIPGQGRVLRQQNSMSARQAMRQVLVLRGHHATTTPGPSVASPPEPKEREPGQKQQNQFEGDDDHGNRYTLHA
jgi:hypothetical protein